MNIFEAIDRSIVVYLNVIATQFDALGFVVTKIGVFGVYLVPIAWVVWWFVAGRKQREFLLSSMLAGILSWQVINRLLKLVYFHERPIHKLPVRELLFERPENSFPSDHTAFLAGISFFFLLKKQMQNARWLLWLAVIVSLCRIAIAVHYPSDILVGFLDGFLGAWIVSQIHDWLCKGLWNWLITLAHKLRLA